MISRRNIIYGLFDPRSGHLRYVGKSTKGLERCASHTCPSSLRDRTKKNGWLKSLLKKGLRPDAVELETFERADQLDEAERHWIAAMRFIGCDLTNMTDGGDGQIGIPCSPERRAKISAAQVGKPKPKWTAERRARPSPLRGQKLSQQHIANQVAGRRAKGYSHSAKTRERMREVMLLRWSKPGHDVEMSRAHGGRPFVDHLENRYETVNGAARATGISASQISRILNGKKPFSGGFTFRYVT